MAKIEARTLTPAEDAAYSKLVHNDYPAACYDLAMARQEIVQLKAQVAEVAALRARVKELEVFAPAWKARKAAELLARREALAAELAAELATLGVSPDE